MIDNQQRIALLKERLTALEPTKLEIIDDSHEHVGHAGAATGMGHFTVIIRSPKFTDKSMIEQHRMVYDALGSLMETEVHALKIKSS